MNAIPKKITVRLGSREYVVELLSDSMFVNGRPVDVRDVTTDDKGGLRFRVGDRRLKAVLDFGAREKFVVFQGRELSVHIETERDRLWQRFAATGHDARHHSEIRASMPGLVVRVVADVGTAVSKGQPVLILEAMKMENEIRAPADGTVKSVAVRKGQAVEKGDLLMVLD